jgi:Mrp family chromosome partitioning ATPase
VIGARVDATLMVVNDNKTYRKQLSRSLELLNQVEATVIGTVLNRVGKGTIDYGYGYSYGYRPYVSKKPKAATNRNGRTKGTPKASSAATREVTQAAPKLEQPAEKKFQ